MEECVGRQGRNGRDSAEPDWLKMWAWYASVREYYAVVQITDASQGENTQVLKELHQVNLILWVAYILGLHGMVCTRVCKKYTMKLKVFFTNKFVTVVRIAYTGRKLKVW